MCFPSVATSVKSFEKTFVDFKLPVGSDKVGSYTWSYTYEYLDME